MKAGEPESMTPFVPEVATGLPKRPKRGVARPHWTLRRSSAVASFPPASAPSRRGLSLATLGQLAVRMLGAASGVVVAAVLARTLTHDDFGRFSLALSLVAIAVNITDFGITPTAVRYVAVHPESTGRIAGALLVVRAGVGCLSGLAVVAIAAALEGTSSGRLVASLIGLSLFFAPLTTVQVIGQARLRIAAISLLLLLQSALWTSAVIILAEVHAHFVWFGVAFLATSGIQGLVTWATFHRDVTVSFKDIARPLRQMLATAWPIGLAGVFVTAYYRLDAVLLFIFRGPGANANYSAAYRFLDILQLLPITLSSVGLPLLAATWRSPTAESLRRRTNLFRLVLRITLAGALPLAVGGSILAPALTSTVYGLHYAVAAPLLATLLLAFPAISLGYVATGMAVARGRTTIYAFIAGGAAVANVIANLELIPLYGAAAAAWTTVATEWTVASVLLAVIARQEGLSLPLWSWLRPAASAAVMAVALLPLRQAPLPLSLTVGVIVYGSAAFISRTVTFTDLRLFAHRTQLEWL